MRRTISIVVAATLAALVGATIVAALRGRSRPLRVVRGVVEPDDVALFRDRATVAAFARRGLDVRVDATSGETMATADLSAYDFALPADTSVAAEVQHDHHVTTTYVPFSTPVVITASAPDARLLAAGGIARRTAGGDWTFDMRRALQPAGGAPVVRSLDLTSSSAVLYLALAAYVANGDAVMAGPDRARELVNAVSPLFLAPATARPSGRASIAVTSEAQVVTGADRGTVAMYPDPGTDMKATLVPLTARGDAVGRTLLNDPALTQAIGRHGFRAGPVPPGAVDPPGYQTLAAFVATVDDALHHAASVAGAGAPAPPSSYPQYYQSSYEVPAGAAGSSG
ncbi:MAG TPA: hypothetical protein VN636_02860 [Acidimicrobiia bacterium]|nr:hypothetical protein [Acidimicrobiia bacterium]